MTPDAYLKLPYARLLIPEDDGTWAAEILEFDGCLACGDTPNEAIAYLERVAASWLVVCLARGLAIPPPSTYKARHHLSLHAESVTQLPSEGEE